MAKPSFIASCSFFGPKVVFILFKHDLWYLQLNGYIKPVDGIWENNFEEYDKTKIYLSLYILLLYI